MNKKNNNKYTRKQILESIKYWQKQLRAGNYKKLNESAGELVLGFRTHDEGGTCEDYTILNNLNEVKTAGLKWIVKAIKDLEIGYVDIAPEDYTEFGYAKQFKAIGNTQFLLKALSRLVSDFQSSSESYAVYDLGRVADNNGTEIFLAYEDEYHDKDGMPVMGWSNYSNY